MSKVKLMLNPNPVNKDKIEALLGKKVECVTQSKRLNNAGVPFIGWTGTTEDEFFMMAFVIGVLTIAISEREQCLTYADALSVVGFSEDCYNRLTVATKAGRPITAEEYQRVVDYNTNVYHKEIESLEFKDVMKLLKWKWKDKKERIDVSDF